MFGVFILKIFRFTIYFIIFLFFNCQIVLSSINDNDINYTIYQLIFEGEYQTAKELLLKEINVNPTDLNTVYMLGTVNYNLNNYNQAGNNFSHILTIDTCNTRAYEMLAKIYTKTGRYRKAENILKKAIQLDTSNFSLKKDLAEILYQMGKYQESGTLFSELINFKNQPTWYLYYMHGLCNLKQDEIENAISSLKHAVVLDSMNVKIKYTIGKAYYIKEEYVTSLIYCNQGLMLDSLHFNLNKLKGDILYLRQQYVQAIHPYTIALKNNPKSLSILKKLGFCYFTAAQYDSAIDTLIEAWKINDKDPLIVFYLGKCYKEKKETEKAIEMFELAAEYSIPDYINGIYIEMGLCFQEVRDYENAIKAIKKSLQFPDSEGIAYYNLANIYYEYYVDKQVALTYYKKVLNYGLSPVITNFVKKRITSILEEQHLKQ
ncbi:MAG: tetratricopeptide repeat protein [bacterium]